MSGPKHLPLIRQLAETECGPACMAMLLSYHGRQTTVQHLRERANTGRDGMTINGLIHIARQEGLSGKIQQVHPGQPHSLRLPALLHWNSKHYVILEKLNTQHASIIDPAIGRQTLTLETFRQNFTGTAVEFTPTHNFHPRKLNTIPHYQRYVSWLFKPTRAKHLLALTLLASLALQGFGFIVPAATAWLVDSRFEWQSSGLIPVIAALASISITRAGISWGRGYSIASLQMLVDQEMTMGFFEHLLRLPHRFFLQHNTGDLLVRLNSNGVIRELFTTQLVTVILDAPMALGFLAALLWMSPTMAALAVASTLAQILIIWQVLGKQSELVSHAIDARSEEHGQTVEILNNITYLKAAAAEMPLFLRWQKAFQRQQQATFKLAVIGATTEGVLGGLRLLTPVGALLIGMHEVNHGLISLGFMLAATTLVQSFTQPVLSLIQSVQQLQLADAYMERILDVIDTTPELPRLNTQTNTQAQTSTATITSTPGHKPKPQRRKVEFRNVHFHFALSTPPVLENVSFNIPQGHSLGIIGATGSGKSTVARLALGLWQPTKGLVLYNNTPVNGTASRETRLRTGAVLQELDIFSGSIRDNITLGTPDASDEALHNASLLACLHNDILAMPLGYNTQIGDRGSALSGGQKQRLALARALLRNPDFLVLDEATSQLDINTERQINENIRQLGCTRLIISHRLSAIADADWVIVLKNGQVAAHGPPHEIISRYKNNSHNTNPNAGTRSGTATNIATGTTTNSNTPNQLRTTKRVRKTRAPTPR